MEPEIYKILKLEDYDKMKLATNGIYENDDSKKIIFNTITSKYWKPTNFKTNSSGIWCCSCGTMGHRSIDCKYTDKGLKLIKTVYLSTF